MTHQGAPASQRSSGWVWFVAGGASALVGRYVLLLFGAPGLVLDLVDMLFPVMGTAAVLAGVGLHRPTRRAPWMMLAAAQSGNLLGDLIGFINREVYHTDPYPSLADVPYLLAYPFLGAALVMFIRRRTPGSNTPALIDSAILSLAVGLVWWLYVIRPLTQGTGSFAERAVSVAYPLMDILLLAIAMRLAVGVGARAASFGLLTGSFTATLVGDIVYGMMTARNVYESNSGWVDWTWPVAYILLGAAALHPSMRSLDARAAVVVRGASRGRLTVLTVAGLFPVALLLARYAAGGKLGLGVPEIAAAAAALFVLMVVRLRGLADVHEQLAIHDGLTGAYSRRFLDEAFRGECMRAQARRVDVAFALVDVDNFMLVNEMYGNVPGDILLAEVAARVHHGVRPGDVVARDSADRFMVLMSGIDPREALFHVERIRTGVSEDRIAVGEGISVRATVSVGLAVMSRDGGTPQALMRAADQALHAAKRAGRNRTYTTYGPVNVEAFAVVTESLGRHGTHSGPTR